MVRGEVKEAFSNARNLLSGQVIVRFLSPATLTYNGKSNTPKAPGW